MRTILYAQASPAEQAIPHQCERAGAAGLPIDEVFADGDAGARSPLAERPEGRRLLHRLGAGDVLVVEHVDCLGRSYAEISDAIRTLMRRGVLVRTIDDRLSFDGATQSPMQQAARDALIAFTAAQADADFKRETLGKRQRPSPEAESLWNAIFNRERSRLQFKVALGLMAAMAVGVFLIGFVLPLQAPRPSSTPPLEQQARGPEAPVEHGAGEKEQEPSQGLQPRVEERSVARQSGTRPDATPEQAVRDAKTRQTHSRNEQDQRAAGEGALSPRRQAEPELARPMTQDGGERTEANEPPLASLSGDEKKIRDTVIEWRSARVQRPDFRVAVGSSVPRHIRLATFPRGLVAQVPRYRGYKFIVADNRIAVVDPATYRIVAIIGE